MGHESRWRQLPWDALLIGALSAMLLPYEAYLLATGGAVALGSTDYMYYMSAVQRFLGDPRTLYLASSAHTLTDFIYPPLAVVLFVPFGLLPPLAGFRVWEALVYGALAWSVGVLVREPEVRLLARGRTQRALLVLAALAIAPAFMTAAYGQVNTIVLALCVVFYAAATRGRPHLAGIALAAAVWIKVFPVLLLAMAARDARFLKAVPSFLAGLALPPLLLSRWIPGGLYATYFLDMLPLMSGRTITHVINQSIPAVTARLGLPLELYTSYEPGGQRALPTPDAGRLAAFAVLAAAAAVTAFSRKPPLLKAGVLLAAIPMAIPLGWGHTYVLVVPLLIYVMAASMAQCPWLQRLLLIAAVLALAVPSYTELPGLRRMPAAIQVLAYSRYAIASAVLIVLAAVGRGPPAAAAPGAR